MLPIMPDEGRVVYSLIRNEAGIRAISAMRRFINEIIDRDDCPVKKRGRKGKQTSNLPPNVLLEDCEFINCEFVSPALNTFGPPTNRSLARNVLLKNCRTNTLWPTGAIFDEVCVEGIRISFFPAQPRGCAFRHVTLSGQCGGFLFSPRVSYDNAERNSQFEADNSKFYENVDWAIDITSVQLSCFELRGSVPARLIRRNREEQFIMSREVAESGKWKKYKPPDHFQIGVSMFLESGVDEELFVAAKRSKYFKIEVEYYHRLRKAGLMH